MFRTTPDWQGRGAQVTFFGPKIWVKLNVLVNNLYRYFFGFLKFCITFLGLKHGEK